MTRDLGGFPDATWDRFFDFIASSEAMTRAEVEAELDRRGIDPRESKARARSIIARLRERASGRPTGEA